MSINSRDTNTSSTQSPSQKPPLADLREFYLWNSQDRRKEAILRKFITSRRARGDEASIQEFQRPGYGRYGRVIRELWPTNQRQTRARRRAKQWREWRKERKEERRITTIGFADERAGETTAVDPGNTIEFLEAALIADAIPAGSNLWRVQTVPEQREPEISEHSASEFEPLTPEWFQARWRDPDVRNREPAEYRGQPIPENERFFNFTLNEMRRYQRPQDIFHDMEKFAAALPPFCEHEPIPPEASEPHRVVSQVSTPPPRNVDRAGYLGPSPFADLAAGAFGLGYGVTPSVGTGQPMGPTTETAPTKAIAPGGFSHISKIPDDRLPYLPMGKGLSGSISADFSNRPQLRTSLPVSWTMGSSVAGKKKPEREMSAEEYSAMWHAREDKFWKEAKELKKKRAEETERLRIMENEQRAAEEMKVDQKEERRQEENKREGWLRSAKKWLGGA